MRARPIRGGVGDLARVRVDLRPPRGAIAVSFSVLDDSLRVEVDLELDGFLLKLQKSNFVLFLLAQRVLEQSLLSPFLGS